MKKLLMLTLSSLMLVGCRRSIPLSTLLEASEGEAMLASINEGIESSLGNKCVDLVNVINIDNLTAESSGVTANITASGSGASQFDVVDNVAYVHSESSVSVSFGYGLPVTGMDISATVDSWTFDGKTATKTDMVLTSYGVSQPQTNYTVTDYSGSVKSLAVETLQEIASYVSEGNWESLSYYGNGSEGDLRIVATNGTLEGVVLDSYEVTYQDGLPREAIIKQTVDPSSLGFSMPMSSTSTITYPDSLDIETPDLTSEEWASASSNIA